MARGRVEFKIPKALIADPRIRRRIAPRMAIVSERLAKAIRRAAPKDTGILVNSIQSEGPDMILGALEMRVNAEVAHAPVMDAGRRPGPVSKTGVARIKLWAKRKGIDASAVFPIVRAIREKGLKPGGTLRGRRRFFTDTIEKLRRAIERRLALAAGGAVKDWFEGR